jgi:transcriptional regulator with XRE-family HTH domain
MDSTLAKAFGRILRELREAKELSQEKLAFECDLDRTYISMLERGIRQPTIETLFALSDALGIKPSEAIARLERKR